MYNPLGTDAGFFNRVRRLREGGFSVLEMSLAVSVVAFGALSALSLTMSSMKLENGNRRAAAAVGAVREVVERLEAVPFEEAFARFNDNPDDDPEGKGTSSGGVFYFAFVRGNGLQRVYDPTLVDDGLFEVKISFPVDNNGDLVEGGELADGLKLDLNNDGVISAGSVVNGDYDVLPMRVEVAWQGQHKSHRAVFHRLLTSQTQSTSAESASTNERKSVADIENLTALVAWADRYRLKFAGTLNQTVSFDTWKALDEANTQAELGGVDNTISKLTTARGHIEDFAVQVPELASEMKQAYVVVEKYLTFYRRVKASQ